LKLPFEERCIAISNMRKDDVIKYNKTQMKVDGHAYKRERSRTSDDHFVLCNGCDGFYSKKYLLNTQSSAGMMLHHSHRHYLLNI